MSEHISWILFAFVILVACCTATGSFRRGLGFGAVIYIVAVVFLHGHC